MPRYRSQSQGGYQGGYGGYNSQQPRQSAAFEYESFFNPIPLDFVQEELGRRQDRFDTSFAGATQGQDEMNQTLVGMPDIEGKRNLVNKSVEGMNKLVDEKYGGDWGRASKEIASRVTSARSNPFWNAQSEAQKQRGLAQELKTKYGQDAFIFNDPTNLSVLDENGQVRGMDQFQPDIVQKGDYVKTAKQLIQGLEPDINAYGLTEAEIDGFLKNKTVSKITEDKIKAFAESEEVQQAFLTQHSEIQRGFNEGSDELKQQFGLEGSAKEFARKQLMGAGRSLINRQEKVDYRVDTPDQVAKAAAAKAAANRVPKPTTNTSDIVGKKWVGQTPTRNFKFNESGNIATAEERVKTWTDTPSPDMMLPVFQSYGIPNVIPPGLIARGLEGIKEFIKISAKGIPIGDDRNIPITALGLMAKEAETIGEFFAKAAVAKDETAYKEIATLHPDLIEAGYTPQEVIDIKSSADEDLQQESQTLFNYGVDWQQATSKNLIYDSDNKSEGRLFNQKLYVNGELVSGTDKEKLVAKQLGYKVGSENFKEAINQSRISDISYTGNTPGEFVMSVPNKNGKSHSTFEIAPHQAIQELATPSWNIAEFIRSAGASKRLQEFTVNGKVAEKDEDGNLRVPTQHRVDTNGDGEKDTDTFYYVESQINPESKKYETRITSVIEIDGEMFRVNDKELTLKDVIDLDKEQVREQLTTNKNKEQTGYTNK